MPFGTVTVTGKVATLPLTVDLAVKVAVNDAGASKSPAAFTLTPALVSSAVRSAAVVVTLTSLSSPF